MTIKAALFLTYATWRLYKIFVINVWYYANCYALGMIAMTATSISEGKIKYIL